MKSTVNVPQKGFGNRLKAKVKGGGEKNSAHRRKSGGRQKEMHTPERTKGKRGALKTGAVPVGEKKTTGVSAEGIRGQVHFLALTLVPLSPKGRGENEYQSLGWRAFRHMKGKKGGIKKEQEAGGN